MVVLYQTHTPTLVLKKINETINRGKSFTTCASTSRWQNHTNHLAMNVCIVVLEQHPHPWSSTHTPTVVLMKINETISWSASFTTCASPLNQQVAESYKSSGFVAKLMHFLSITVNFYRTVNDKGISQQNYNNYKNSID